MAERVRAALARRGARVLHEAEGEEGGIVVIGEGLHPERSRCRGPRTRSAAAVQACQVISPAPHLFEEAPEPGRPVGREILECRRGGPHDDEAVVLADRGKPEGSLDLVDIGVKFLAELDDLEGQAPPEEGGGVPLLPVGDRDGKGILVRVDEELPLDCRDAQEGSRVEILREGGEARRAIGRGRRAPRSASSSR